MSPDDAARDLYRRVIDGWNAGDAEAMTAPMAADALDDRLRRQAAESSAETSEIMPDRKAVQTLVAARGPGEALTEQD